MYEVAKAHKRYGYAERLPHTCRSCAVCTRGTLTLRASDPRPYPLLGDIAWTFTLRSPAHRSCIWCSPWRSSTCGVSHEIWRGWAHGGPPECESQTGPSGSVLQFGWAPPCMLPDAPLLQPESAVARRSPNPPPPHTTHDACTTSESPHRRPHTPGGPFHLDIPPAAHTWGSLPLGELV